MKNTVLLLAILLLSACAAKFDTVEYGRLVDMRHIANSSVCVSLEDTKDTLLLLQEYVQKQAIYSKHLPNNTATIEMVDALQNTVDRFAAQYASRDTASLAFCRIQMNIISSQLDAMLATIGRRPR